MNKRVFTALRKLAAAKPNEAAKEAKQPKQQTNQEAMSKILANIANKTKASNKGAVSKTQPAAKPEVKAQPTKVQKEAEQRTKDRPATDDNKVIKQAKAWGIM